MRTHDGSIIPFPIPRQLTAKSVSEMIQKVSDLAEHSKTDISVSGASHKNGQVTWFLEH